MCGQLPQAPPSDFINKVDCTLELWAKIRCCVRHFVRAMRQVTVTQSIITKWVLARGFISWQQSKVKPPAQKTAIVLVGLAMYVFWLDISPLICLWGMGTMFPPWSFPQTHRTLLRPDGEKLPFSVEESYCWEFRNTPLFHIPYWGTYRSQVVCVVSHVCILRKDFQGASENLGLLHKI